MTAPASLATVECEEHVAPPVVDGIASAAFAGFGAAVIAGTSNADDHLPEVALVAVPALVIGTLDLASALHGVGVNRACRAATR